MASFSTALVVLVALAGYSHAQWAPATHVNYGPRPGDISGWGRQGPPTTDLPAGWSADYGQVFGVRVGSQNRYGWNADHSGGGLYDQTRLRAGVGVSIMDRSGIIPDRNLQHDGESVWQYEVAAGRYRVAIRYSDPQYPSVTEGCMLQGSSAAVGVVPRNTPTEFTNDNVIVVADGPYANRIYFSGQFVLNLPGDAEPTGCSLISSISIERWGTDAPTLAPSTSPTGWFEAAGHPENITELQGQTQDLATTVSALGDSVAAIQRTMLVQQTALTRLASSVNPAVTTLQADVSRLRAAIADAVDIVPDVIRSNSGASSGAVPSISAQGSDVMVTAARGGFTVETAACAAFDPCDIIAALNRLRQA